jgi:single-strand DNA-binding protein
MTITGIIYDITPLESVGANGFTKQTLVVKTDSKYDNTVPIEFVKDKTALLNGLAQGQAVTVHINIGGREWNGKYFPSVMGWKVDAQAASTPAPATVASKPAPVAPVAEVVEDDDLPF